MQGKDSVSAVETEYTVTLKIDQNLTFDVKGAGDAASAYRIAVSRWEDGAPADDTGWPLVELIHIKVGEHSVRINSTLDWNGPLDSRGMHRWKFTAIDDNTNNALAEGHDTADVVQRAIERVSSQ